MIILVEDDPDQRLALGMALKVAGYPVREAANGAEALALQRERAARFLITDLFMPETDGFELVQAFRKDYPETKIVVISGGGKRSRRDYLTDIGRWMDVDATLQKPVEVEVLLQRLRDLSIE